MRYGRSKWVKKILNEDPRSSFPRSFFILILLCFGRKHFIRKMLVQKAFRTRLPKATVGEYPPKPRKFDVTRRANFP